MTQELLDIIVPVLALAGFGYALARLAPASFAGVSELLLHAAIPALALDSLTRHAPSFSALTHMALAACLVVLGTGAVALGVVRLAGLPLRGVLMPSMFMNAGNFGVPLAFLAWGEPGLSIAVLYYLTMSVLQNSLGVWIAHGGAAGLREMARLPLIYSVALGLVLTAADVRVPSLVATPLHMLAQTAVPLMLLSLGHALEQQRGIRWQPALVAVAVRMGVGVGFGVAATMLLGLSGLERSVAILASSMPAAVMNVVLARRYGADPDVVASAVFLSTLLSLVTIPAVLALLGP